VDDGVDVNNLVGSDVVTLLKVGTVWLVGLVNIGVLVKVI